jgi:hypothetical protein
MVFEYRALIVSANIHSMLILSTMIMEAIHCSELMVLTRVTWRHTQEDRVFIVTIMKT